MQQPFRKLTEKKCAETRSFKRMENERQTRMLPHQSTDELMLRTQPPTVLENSGEPDRELVHVIVAGEDFADLVAAIGSCLASCCAIITHQLVFRCLRAHNI
jgi:hypothetical protein